MSVPRALSSRCTTRRNFTLVHQLLTPVQIKGAAQTQVSLKAIKYIPWRWNTCAYSNYFAPTSSSQSPSLAVRGCTMLTNMQENQYPHLSIPMRGCLFIFLWVGGFRLQVPELRKVVPKFNADCRYWQGKFVSKIDHKWLIRQENYNLFLISHIYSFKCGTITPH